MKVILFFLTLLTFYTNTSLAEDEIVVRHVSPEGNLDKRHTYFIALLSLALEKTRAQDGPFRLAMHEGKMTQARAILSVAQKYSLDIVWTMTSKDREEILQPIRIPLLKGLLGHRIFIIRQQDKEKFAQIQSPNELKRLIAGQGHDWPDTRILKENGYKVMAVTSYDSLFSMLSLGRFDYSPRGVTEAWAEVDAHPEKELMVEETLLLKYPASIYFFVHKTNTLLADRIERGLLLSTADGSFDRLFNEHTTSKTHDKYINIKNRKIFHLTNPFTHEVSQ